jgi:HEAT repeat protein
MKKVIILAVVFFITIAFANAQDVENKENSEDVNQTGSPAQEVEKKSEDVKSGSPASELTQPEQALSKQVAEKQSPAKEEPKSQAKAGKETYIADLSSKDENKVVTAAEWLGEKEEKSAVPQLIDLLKNDKRTKVRLYATIALALIGDEACIPTLNDALIGDSSADVRYAVLLAIHRINPAKSLDALKKAKESESDPYIKDYIEKMETKWKEKK